MVELTNTLPYATIYDYEGKSFYYACKKGDLKMTQKLIDLERDSVVNISISTGRNKAFAYACKKGKLEIAQWLYNLSREMNLEPISDLISKIQ